MTDKTQFQQRLSSQTVTILDGETISSVASLNGTSLLAFDIPAGFTGTVITFLVSSDGTNYLPYHRMGDGGAAKARVNADNANNPYAYATESTDFAGYNFIKLVAGTTQTTDIAITLKTRPLN